MSIKDDLKRDLIQSNYLDGVISMIEETLRNDVIVSPRSPFPGRPTLPALSVRKKYGNLLYQMGITEQFSMGTTVELYCLTPKGRQYWMKVTNSDG